jgi:hypothetical protein
MGTLGIAGRPHGGDAGVTEAVASSAKLGSLPLAEIIRRGWRRMMETRALVVMGFVGIGLGLICLAVMAARGGVPIPPEGDLARRFFRRDRRDADSPILLAIRYGTAAAIAAFTAGIWTSVIGGRTTGHWKHSPAARARISRASGGSAHRASATLVRLR